MLLYIAYFTLHLLCSRSRRHIAKPREVSRQRRVHFQDTRATVCAHQWQVHCLGMSWILICFAHNRLVRMVRLSDDQFRSGQPLSIPPNSLTNGTGSMIQHGWLGPRPSWPGSCQPQLATWWGNKSYYPAENEHGISKTLVGRGKSLSGCHSRVPCWYSGEYLVAKLGIPSRFKIQYMNR